MWNFFPATQNEIFHLIVRHRFLFLEPDDDSMKGKLCNEITFSRIFFLHFSPPTHARASLMAQQDKLSRKLQLCGDDTSP